MTGSCPRHTQNLEMRKDSNEPEPARDLNALERREALACSPDELVGTSWEQDWDVEA
jgi:hypothetical protein